MTSQSRHLVIEDTNTGSAVIAELNRERRAGTGKVHGFRPEQDKETWLAVQSPKIESGHLFLPREAKWLSDFRDEISQFPTGRHDDQVDALSQLLGFVEWRAKNRSGSGRTIGMY